MKIKLNILTNMIVLFITLIPFVQAADNEEEAVLTLCKRFNLCRNDWTPAKSDKDAAAQLANDLSLINNSDLNRNEILTPLYVEEFANEVYCEVKGKASNLNEYGVTNLEWAAAFYFYNVNRFFSAPNVLFSPPKLNIDQFKEVDHKGFALLYDLFANMPQDKREKAFEVLNALCCAYGTGPSLGEIKGLKEKLLTISQ